jgi:2-polyprenyl-3-methyl-5-hydroxy-6-metoxy-1,4-benzoquinol methylase
MEIKKQESVSPICHICGSSDVEFFCKKNGYELFECKQCTLLFVYPIPSNLAEIYTEDYFKNQGKQEAGYTDYDKDKEPMREIFQLYLNKLSLLISGRNIFDVGAATGYFLDIAKSNGWKTHGSEISEYAARTAHTRGHEMFTGSITGLYFKEKMHVATLWDVLEHVDSPRSYLSMLNNMLEEGGMLAINTVDRSSMWARMMDSRWHLIVPPEHLYYYSPKNLQLLLEQTGFSILEVKKIGKKFSPAYVFKTLASWQGMPLWGWLAKKTDSPFFRKLALPINLRDNIFVIARKVRNI